MRTIIQSCSAVVLLATVAPVALGLAVGHAQSSDPWVARATKVQFERMRAADAPLQLDFPKKDWMVLPSSRSALLVLASRKGDAVVLVERVALRAALDPSSITEVFAQIEIDTIKDQQPKATEFLSRVLDTGQQKLVAVQYSRPGVLGTERVRQYAVPVGKVLYYVTCISSASQFAAYDPVFSHIAGSFAVIE